MRIALDSYMCVSNKHQLKNNKKSYELQFKHTHTHKTISAFFSVHYFLKSGEMYREQYYNKYGCCVWLRVCLCYVYFVCTLHTVLYIAIFIFISTEKRNNAHLFLIHFQLFGIVSSISSSCFSVSLPPSLSIAVSVWLSGKSIRNTHSHTLY